MTKRAHKQTELDWCHSSFIISGIFQMICSTLHNLCLRAPKFMLKLKTKHENTRIHTDILQYSPEEHRINPLGVQHFKHSPDNKTQVHNCKIKNKNLQWQSY